MAQLISSGNRQVRRFNRVTPCGCFVLPPFDFECNCSDAKLKLRGSARLKCYRRLCALRFSRDFAAFTYARTSTIGPAGFSENCP